MKHKRVSEFAPFAGLGFKLDAARQAAPMLRLRRIAPETKEPRPVSAYDVPPVWGYGLLLRLDRETGGS